MSKQEYTTPTISVTKVEMENTLAGDAGEGSVVSKEEIWLERLRDYIKKSEDKGENRDKVCTWWLRLEYGTPTAQINYWLNKSHAKGILGKDTSCYYTRFWFIEESEVTNG